MGDYDAVERELKAGTPPELICATCPWDRLCVKPPAMTAADVQRHIEEAERKDRERNPEGMPTGALLTALTFGGRDGRGEMCPVFISRLRHPKGRGLADMVRAAMQEWEAES